MAIPVFLRDTFYLVENATSEEIFKILKEEGINSSTLRGKATMQFPAAAFDTIKPVIKTSLSEANMAFYQVGDSFFAMPITDVELLGYHKAEDGSLFTSLQDYHTNALSKKSNGAKQEQIPDPFARGVVVDKIPEPFVKKNAATQIPNPFVGEVVEENAVELNGTGAQLIKDGAVVSPTTFRYVNPADLGDAQEMVMVNKLLSAGPGPEAVVVEEADAAAIEEADAAVIEEAQYREEYTDEQITFLENAYFLDTVLSNGKYHKIADYLLFALDDVKRLLDAVGEDYEQQIKIPTLEAADMIEYVTGTLPEGVFKNAVGESAKLTDAMIMLPVFSALLGKKNKSLQNKFSVANLVDSKFARISVAGISENGAFWGFVHFETITNEAVAAAKKKVEEHLSAEGKKFNDLTSQEKYELYLKEIGAYFVAHKDCGKMLAAPNSGRYVELSRALADMEKQKFSVPEFNDQEEGMIIWPSYETISFDNRGEKTLSEQAKELIKPIRVPVSGTAAVSSVITNNDTSVSLVQRNMSVIALPSSFEEHDDDVVILEEPKSGLTDAEVEKLLRTLVSGSGLPAVSKKTGVGAGETLIEGSIGFSGLPSLTNPIAFIDDHGHQWESKAAYDEAMRLIGVSGDLLDANPLVSGDDSVVKGK